MEEVSQVLHMNGGMGETSYANNSMVQQKVIAMTKAITEEAITSLCYASFPTSLAIADLGCSSGPNTFMAVSEVIKAVHEVCRKQGRTSPEYQVFLNDLPGNDFNTIFRSVPSFQHKLTTELGLGCGPCFVTGVPGSFYGRLFAANSLHFVHSSYSIMWLSQVPDELEDNKGNIYVASTSPPSVLQAYLQQFQNDFSFFLKCRSKELVPGGRMVLTLLGRKSEDPTSKEGGYIWELMARALSQMVSEGLIEEEKLNTFNIPQYTPCPSEVKAEVLKEGSFVVNRLEVSEVNWNNAYNYDSSGSTGSTIPSNDGGHSVAKCMRAVAEPLLASHFGGGIIDEVFRRYREILADCISKETTQFYNVTVSLTKRILI